MLLRVLLSRISTLLRLPRADPAFDQELEVHLSLLRERFLREGMSAEQADYAVLRQFGGVAQLKELRHDATTFPFLEALARDVRQSVRALRRNPGFTATALAVLALGIGANTAIFSVVNTVLFRPLNVPGADRIVRFLQTDTHGSDPLASLPEYNAWRQANTTLEDIAAHRLDLANLTGAPYPEQVPLARVTANFFHLFGVPLLHGRAFSPAEDSPGGPPVAVLGYGLWTRRYASNPRVIGQTILLGSAPYTVIGILAPGFDTEQFRTPPDVFLPFQIDPVTAERGSFCTVSGRLKPGLTVAAANAELKSLAEEYRGMLTGLNPQSTFAVMPVREAMASAARPFLTLMSVAVGVVLLIASANVANLLLIYSTVRRREIAIRAAVGAGRARIVRQILTESLVLSVAGGALGLLLGFAGIRALLSLYPTTAQFFTILDSAAIPRLGVDGSAVTLDWRVLAFTVAVSLATGILFGLVPALQASRSDLSTTLKESGSRSGASFRQNKARSFFVVSEVALALILVVGAALLIRAYVALRSVQPGFETRQVVTTQMSVTGTRFEKTADLDRLVREGSAGIHALPGVEHAAAACCIPLETVWQLSYIVVGRPLHGRIHGMAGWTFVSPEYFEVFRIPLLRGRAFNSRDTAGAPGVVIINQAMARAVWPDRDPLGDRLIIGKTVRPEYDSDTERQIVGIVGDIRDTTLQNPPRPGMYVPIAQLPGRVNVLNLRLLPLAWFVRVRSESPSLGTSIQHQLSQASGGIPATAIRSMDGVSLQSTARAGFSTLLMTVFGISALLLAAIGIYGLIAYSVEQRTQEIGIRMALGASRSSVRNMVVAQGMRLAMIGLAIGLAAAFGLTGLLSGFLYGVKARDPLIFLAAPLFLAAVAFLAVWFPARSATCVDPVDALRCD